VRYNTLKIAIVGYGKMGRMIERIAASRAIWKATASVARAPAQGMFGLIERNKFIFYL
jgi:glyceraldehyde-3-phosphate dehydrogenase/erythrose-4-phosphate dehydrogenase